MNCFKCNNMLTPVQGDSEQSYDSVMFYSHGTYGSRVFDPMDGTYLLINICDRCLKRPRQDVIVVGRDRRPVIIEGHGQCGWEHIDRPTIPWTPDLSGFDQDDCVTFSTVEEALPYETNHRITWNVRPSVFLKETLDK